jgi:ABC-type transport system involved in multi-copper enzyme maturation permease subunit
MRTKEWRDVTRQALYFILFLLAMHLFMFLAGKVLPNSSVTADQVVAFNSLALLMFALLTGIGAFASERSQNAMEYTLALPITRLQLLREKFLPRLASVLLFSFLFWLLLAALGQLPPAPTLIFLTLLLLLLFLVSFSLSLSSKNFVALFFTATLCFVLLALAAQLTALIGFQLKTSLLSGHPFSFRLLLDGMETSLSRGGLAQIVPLIIMLLPLPLAFALAFPRFDPRPRSVFNRRLARRAAVLLVPALILAAFFSCFIWKNPGYFFGYQLTSDRHLIEMRYSSMIVYGPDGSWKPDLPVSWGSHFLNETKDGWLYFVGFTSETKCLMRIKPTTRQAEVIHKCMDFFSFPLLDDSGHVWFLENIPYSGRPVYSPNVKHAALRLVEIDLATREKRSFRFVDPLLEGQWQPRILLTSMLSGKRFWIVRSGNHQSILRLWQDGHVENLASPDTGSLFHVILINGDRAIFTTTKALHVGRLTETGFESTAHVPGQFDLGILYWMHEAQASGLKTVFAWESRVPDRFGYMLADIVAIDLDTLTTNDLGGGFSLVRAISGNEAWFIRSPGRVVQDAENTVFHYQVGKLKEIGRLPTCTIVNMSSTGIVTRLPDGKIAVYAFPDLKPLTYPGLN